MTAEADEGLLLGGRYRLEEPVGSGGAGQVWRATDSVLQRMVAVKLLRTEVARDPLTNAMFLAEARSASRLSHPGIAQVHDYGYDRRAEVPFLVMEFVDGASLAALVAAGPLAADRVIDVIAQVAAGLHAAHSAGVVHRDIKPANLLVSRKGQIKITDFGIASVISSVPVTSTGLVIGTPAYLAPERATGAPATPSSDLYSLGVVGYECLTGSQPFSGPASEVIAAHLSRPFPLLPATVPADIGLLVATLTAREPARRPHSAREVAERAAALLPSPVGQTALPEGIWRDLFEAGSVASGPATLTDIRHLAPPASGSAHLRKSARVRARRIWQAAGAVLAITAALVTVGVAAWRAGLNAASGSPTTVAPSPASSQPVSGVQVDSASFDGLPVSQVLTALRRLGLRPVLKWAATSAQPPGTVLSVRPTGFLLPGSVVTVTAATEPPPVDGNHDGGGTDGGGGGTDGGH